MWSVMDVMFCERAVDATCGGCDVDVLMDGKNSIELVFWAAFHNIFRKYSWEIFNKIVAILK